MKRPVLLFDVMETLVEEPFYRAVPAFFGMELDELVRAKHPSAWAEFELGAIGEATLFARFFKDARAVDGDGSVLITRFDFAGLVSLDGDASPAPAPAPDLFPALERTELSVETQSSSHRLTAWIADDDETRARGLMHVRELPPDTGMLFVFEQPHYASFWMKDTYLSLDLIFMSPDGTVINIIPDAKPMSLQPLQSAGPARYVLELVAGSAARMGLKAGDRMTSPYFAMR